MNVLPLEVGKLTTTERSPDPSRPSSLRVRLWGGSISKIGRARSRVVSDSTNCVTLLFTARVTVQMLLSTINRAVRASSRDSVSSSIRWPRADAPDCSVELRFELLANVEAATD